MRLLISFVNSPLSLGGFDWETGELFWRVPSERLRACGVCYWNDGLLVSSDNAVTRLERHGRGVIRLPGPHPGLSHSVHPLGNDRFGVIDTGNSALRVYDGTGRLSASYGPVNAWGDVPADAVHLNDFAVTPEGIVGSCFDYRPWRVAQRDSTWTDWCRGRYGVLLNLAGHAPWGAGSILACGLNHPHSLTFHAGRIYHCSSATGTFHAWRFDSRQRLMPDGDWHITDRHFLRGAHHDAGHWYLGGSTTRHGERLCGQMAIYRLHEATGRIEERTLPLAGEIYDILPWREDVPELCSFSEN